MSLLEKLARLEKIGIPQTILANYCHCHKTTINKLLRGEANASEKMEYLIEDGLNKLFNDIKEIEEG
jgi:plasmid maintenance system antidote protein VapI